MNRTKQTSMNRISTKQMIALVAVAAILIGFSSRAVAQGWPVRPVRVIVPFTAGSGSDIVTRIVMEQLTRQLGQPILVENRVGAGGTLGPFKGAAEVLAEVGTGRVDFAFMPILSSLSTIRDKKLLALAVN